LNIKEFLRKQFPNFSKDQDLKFLYKNSKYKLSLQIIIFVVGFFTSWCFGNFTSSEFYGTYLFIINTTQFFAFLGFNGISQSIIQSVSSGYKYFYITAIKKLIILSLSGTLAIFTYSIVYSVFYEFNLNILISLIFISITFPFLNSVSRYNFYLEGESNFKKEFKYQLISYVILVSYLMILIFLTKNIILHFILLRLTNIGLYSYFTYKNFKIIKNTFKDKVLDKKALKYGIDLTKYNIITLISSNINNLIVGSFFGPATLAFFTVGKGLSTKINSLIKPSFSVLLTRYSQKNSKMSKKFLFLLIIGSIILFIGNILILPIYLQILFPKYLDSISYGIAYAFILLVTPSNIVLGYYFRGKAQIKIIRNSQIIPDVLTLFLIFPLLMFFGIYGLILNVFLRFLIRLIIYTIYWKKIEFSS